MELYSFKGQEPKPLPFKVRLNDGSSRTSLHELNLDELNSLGFIGPVNIPNYDTESQKIEWDGKKYNILQLSEEELIAKEESEKIQRLKNLNYNLFWDLLISSNLYRKLRSAASQSLLANTICTELIALFMDAKNGNPNINMIQHYINIIFFIFELSEDEIEELKNLLDKSNLVMQYILPNKEFISSHIYDPETNSILHNSPFESWNLINGKWEAPINYPTDGKIYNWNEDLKNWVEI